MRVSKFLHSCLLVEKGADKILLDPGKYCFLDGRVTIDRFDGITAVLVTHSHPDHVDVEKLRGIVERSRAEVHAPSDLAAKLRADGIEARDFDEGSRRIASFDVRAIPAPHERVLTPVLPQNTAYVIDERLLHPGDSYAPSLDTCRGIPLLALPLVAPWTTDLGTAAFAVRLAPERAMPIHDAQVKDFAVTGFHDRVGGHLRRLGIAYEPADEPGASVEI